MVTLPSRKKANVLAVYSIGSLLLIIGLFTSIVIGVTDISAGSSIKSLFVWTGSKEQLIIQTLRLPRALVGGLVGAGLAVAGAIMQALTRNPLASPQVFGINAGASLAVVASVVLVSSATSIHLVYFAFAGAAFGGAIIYFCASAGGLTPVKLALAGMSIHFLLSSLTQGLILFDENATDVLFWLAGSLNNSNWNAVQQLLPWSIIGLTTAILLSGSISILGLGDETSKSLGQRVALIRLAASAIVIILAGSAVSVTGPIGFIGLMVPHIVRKMVGQDYRVILPLSALFGAVVLTYADALARLLAYPFETPVGIVTALIGGPFFLYLARKERGIKR
ncbi:iron-siderophore ABC transporter permease [Paenibacillus sp. BIHB 4019]|uniref:Iron-siderophore ABC transporter permease n=1 Tax=Paenibacillus sp. BIHB 4019 TaxID=1870819 RepID=A0A1B2DIZ3_9BACL|nr:iron ABC transporter permease [Paenibacillus sp. BIHB 4019]ANY67645.1 iron-siderophore ABC transporter permease [Paenibacillus sp. BIHB 4019]